MYQMNILHTQKQKDTSVSDAGDMNRNTLKHSAVDGNKKNVLPPPTGVTVVIDCAFYVPMHQARSEILRIYHRAA